MTLKMRVMTKFPALVNTAVGMAVERVGRAYTFLYDWMNIDTVDSVADPSTRFILLVSGTVDDQLYERIALDDFLASVAVNVQIVDSSGSHNVSAATTLLIVDPAVAGAVTLVMPAASAKVGPVKIVDWAGGAGSNTITITLDGSEEFQGGQTTWTISGNGGSVVLTPYAGSGYAV